MPKRVKSLISIDTSSLSDNELVILGEGRGLGLKYGEDEQNNPIVYEFNGNRKLMKFIEEKQKMGGNNKSIETLNYTANIVPSITDESEKYNI